MVALALIEMEKVIEAEEVLEGVAEEDGEGTKMT